MPSLASSCLVVLLLSITQLAHVACCTRFLCCSVVLLLSTSQLDYQVSSMYKYHYDHDNINPRPRKGRRRLRRGMYASTYFVSYENIPKKLQPGPRDDSQFHGLMCVRDEMTRCTRGTKTFRTAIYDSHQNKDNFGVCRPCTEQRERLSSTR